MSEVLSFRYPRVLGSGGGLKANQESYITTLPTNGSIFRSDQNQSITFNIAHNAAFLRTAMSFLAFSVLPYTGENTPLGDTSGEQGGGVKITQQGISRIFNRVVIRFGGVIVDDLNYSDLLALYYATCPESKKALLRAFEAYDSQNYFAKGGSKKFCHLLFSSLWATDQCLPLPLMASGAGISIELYIAPASEVFLDPRVKFFEIRSPSFKWQGVYPDASFTLSLRGAVQNSGKSAYIPYQRIRGLPSTGNGSATQQIVMPIGQVSSIVSVDTVMWDEVAYGDVTQDKSKRFLNMYGLTDWKLEGAGQSNPSQLTFRHDQGTDPETVFIGLISQAGNAYVMDRDVSIDPEFLTNSFRISPNFQSSVPVESFGSGLSTIGSASSFLTLTTTHSQAVPTTARIMSFVTTDALIEFRGSEIILSEIF